MILMMIKVMIKMMTMQKVSEHAGAAESPAYWNDGQLVQSKMKTSRLWYSEPGRDAWSETLGLHGVC